MLEKNGWLWLAALAALIAGAIFQSYHIWWLVVLFVVGPFVIAALEGDKRAGPSDAEGTGEGSSGTGGMEG